jgi:hypothetical protein
MRVELWHTIANTAGHQMQEVPAVIVEIEQLQTTANNKYLMGIPL